LVFIFLLLAPAYLVAEPPGFYYLLDFPSGHITGYPAESPKPVVSISFYNIPKLKSLFETPPLTTGSSYKNNTLTFTATYYKKLDFIYAYVPRTVDASAFLRYRLQSNLSRRMSEFRAKGLSKDQRQKEGGLLSVNIPVKSKAFESIFGEGGAGLKVSGYHQITFSGRSQWDNRAATATYRQNKFPSLNMEQISRFDINGTIGTKITVSVSQDSKTDIPLANRIMIRYKGDEDDIIKDIEAGNTTLSLPNTQFVGYSSRIQGLFGLKTSAQIGAVTLTAIASQEKGTTERSTITAGSSASKTNIRDYSYINGKIYDLGRRADLDQEKKSDFNDKDSIMALEVYTAINAYQTDVGTTIEAKFYVDPKNPLADTSENTSALIRPEPVDKNSYYINIKEHWILFDTPNAGATNEIGVWMIVKRSTGVIDTIGDISQPQGPYSLKLIKHRNSDSSMVTWNYMWRNVYSLNAQNIDVGGLDIKIYKGLVNTENSGDNLDHQSGPKFIKILGLDVHNPDGTGLPDGLTDIKNSNIIDAARGLLIFPDRHPFDPAENTYDTTGLLVKVPEIYAYPSGTEQPILKSTYYIEISNSSRNSAISLGKANILDGSERITINGKLMERGTDYNIQYDYGAVTFLTDEALDPNANISIEFEYSPYITSEKKTLFGIRSEYASGQNFKVGSTFLYKSDKATERKPKIGQETAKTMVWDGDISFQVRPNFLSKVANLLPFYSTKNESSLGISAEIAKSFPNPNVDGTAYIDDFEGARDSYSLGVFRENWTLSSKPIGLDPTRLRGRLIWYNPWNQVPTNQIWNKEVDPTQQGTHTLWLKYYPAKIDRRDGTIPSDTVNFDPAECWAGIMRYMTAGSANQEQAQLLELRVNGQKGILHIDMGNISEDINGNNALDSEDKQENGRYINQIIDPGEDIGIDGIKNTEEPGYDQAMNPDPNGDDWEYTEGSDDYSRINGTEANALDPNRSGKPDTEDLFYNGSLDNKNNYYSYKIDLDKGTFLVEGSENDYKWRTFRIPIKDTAAIDTVIGAPLWTQINFVRMWIESPNGDSLDIRIAAADLIQSNWNDTLIPGNPLVPTSSKFKVAVVNQQENANYRPPPGVTGYYDKTSSLTEPEQSLLLSYDSLVAGDVGMAERFLYDTPSLVGYRKLHMYVHGPLGVNLMQFFFRVGQDTSNFYEYRTMLTSDWATENNVEIDFNEITALKEYLLQSRMEHPDLPYDTVDNHYRIHGRPNITKIKYLACGVINLDSSGFQSGEVWVDELRVTEVRRDVGTAARASVSGNVADLFSYSGGITYRDSYFRGLSASTRGGSQDNLGSGSSSKSYNYSIYFNLDRFLPRSLGASIPISYRYNQNTEVPLLRFGTDIILPEKLRDQEKTTSISKGLTISESFNKPGKNPLFSLLLNRLKSSFSYSRTESSSPSSPMSFIENYHINGRYDYTFTNVPNIKPFFWTGPIPLLNKMAGTRFYFLPNNFNTSADLDRTLQISENSSNVRTDNLKRDFRGSYQLSYKISDNLTANYSMETRRDLADPDLVSFRLSPFSLRLGQETDYSQNFSASYNPVIFSFLTHQLTYGASYRENLNVSDSALNAGSSKSYGINGNLNLKKFISGGDSKKVRRTRMQEKIAAEEEAKTKKKADSGPGPISKTFQFLTGWLNPITYDFNERYNYTFTGLEERAQFKFRMGLSGDVGASQKTNARSSGYSNASSKSTAITLGSGTVFFGGLKTDVTFNRKVDQDIVKSVNPQKTVSTVFPDFRFTIQPLTTIKIFNPIIRRFNPRTGYSKSRGEVFNLQSGFKSTERTTTSQRPLLSINFDILRGMQINFSTDRSVTDENIINSQNGNLTSRTRTTVKNTSISTKYSFSAPSGIKFPLLGKLRIQSTMSIAVDVTMRKTKSESASGNRPLASSGEQSDLLIVPNISYTFSSQIKGSFSARWQDTNNIATQTKSHVRELRITVDIRF
jgi:cell surface protein SprA